MESTSGRTDRLTTGSGWTMKSMESGPSNGKMVAAIEVNGKEATCTVWVSTHGAMRKSIKGSISTTKRRVTESTNGQMEGYIRVTG